MGPGRGRSGESARPGRRGPAHSKSAYGFPIVKGPAPQSARTRDSRHAAHLSGLPYGLPHRTCGARRGRADRPLRAVPDDVVRSPGGSHAGTGDRRRRRGGRGGAWQPAGRANRRAAAGSGLLGRYGDGRCCRWSAPCARDSGWIPPDGGEGLVRIFSAASSHRFRQALTRTGEARGSGGNPWRRGCRRDQFTRQRRAHAAGPRWLLCRNRPASEPARTRIPGRAYRAGNARWDSRSDHRRRDRECRRAHGGGATAATRRGSRRRTGGLFLDGAPAAFRPPAR